MTSSRSSDFCGLTEEQLRRLVAKGIELAGRAKTANEFRASLTPVLQILRFLNRGETAAEKQARLETLFAEMGIGTEEVQEP